MQSIRRTFRVLVVEDDDDTRQLMLGFVRELGFEAAEASSAREGLAILRTGAVAAILTDYSMAPEEETGCWMLERAQNEGLLARVRLIVLCTGSGHVATSVPGVTITVKPMDLGRVRGELARAMPFEA